MEADRAVTTPQSNVSVARWEPKMGMAEVLLRRGKLWASIGIIRNCKLYCHVEEALYMVEQGSLLLLQGDTALTCHDVYDLLVVPSHGCSWNAYQIFCHLKRLGYIVGRHNTIWSTSIKKVQLNATEASQVLDSKEEAESKDGSLTPANSIPSFGEINSDGCLSDGEENISTVLEADHISAGEEADHINIYEEADDVMAGEDFLRDKNEKTDESTLNGSGLPLRHNRNEKRDELSCSGSVNLSVEDSENDHFPRLPLLFTTLKLWEDPDACISAEESEYNVMFDVHLPNGRFKKTAPGFPAFSLCILDGHPPQQRQVRALGLKIGHTILKFGSVECGHVSIFSFSSCILPTLL